MYLLAELSHKKEVTGQIYANKDTLKRFNRILLQYIRQVIKKKFEVGMEMKERFKKC